MNDLDQTPVVSSDTTLDTPIIVGPVLSSREEDVLQRIARGYPNKEIARDLALSRKTVETYKARGLEKLGLSTRVALVRYASRRGWLADL